MAQKVTIALEDDLDGGPAEETARFGLGGAEYEIDLSTTNAKAFRQQLAPYLAHAARRDEGSAAARCVAQRAVSAARASGRGRKTRTSRSAPVGASPPASSSSTKPPWESPDLRQNHGRPGPVLAQMGP
jgi:Lsr2